MQMVVCFFFFFFWLYDESTIYIIYIIRRIDKASGTMRKDLMNIEINLSFNHFRQKETKLFSTNVLVLRIGV